MALSEEGGNGGIPATMLVGPANIGGNGMYPYPIFQNGGNGNNGFGGQDGWWIVLLIILLAAGGWNGNNGGNGGGMFGGMPYVVNNDCGNVQRGFDQAAVMSGIGDINNNLFGVQNSLCNGFASVNATVNNGFAQAEIADNARQLASMNQIFGLSTQLAQCCCDNRLATCQTQNVIQSEGSATRFADANNTRDIIENQTRSTQLILDKLCQQEIDALKTQNLSLQNQLNMATLRESQTAQTATIQRGQVAEIDALYQRLKDCPVGTMPVYGNQPIFTCPTNNNNGCGCGCGNGNF